MTHSRANMVVTDGLAPIWRQGIWNYLDGVTQSTYISISGVQSIQGANFGA